MITQNPFHLYLSFKIQVVLIFTRFKLKPLDDSNVSVKKWLFNATIFIYLIYFEKNE